MKLNVLYEDNHLIAVVKPFNMSVQRDESGDICLMDEVKDFLKNKYKKTGNIFLGLLHRLDRPVSGIVLFSKTSKGASRLSEQIRSHSFKKTYFALLEGALATKEGVLINFLKRDEKKNITRVYNKEISGALRAELSFEVLKLKGNKTFVKINLKTGRHHQIRAQFSHLGYPLVGDIKYGASKPLPQKNIALFAGELSFKTATGNKQIVLSAPLPDCLII